MAVLPPSASQSSSKNGYCALALAANGNGEVAQFLSTSSHQEKKILERTLDVDQYAVDCIRATCLDIVKPKNFGHPGLC